MKNMVFCNVTKLSIGLELLLRASVFAAVYLNEACGMIMTV